MNNQSRNLIIIGVLVGFLIIVTIGTVVFALALRGDSNSALPAGQNTGGAQVIANTSVANGGGAKPEEYVQRKSDDETFRCEVLPGFHFETSDETIKMSEGVMVHVRKYTAGGGKGAIDGFAVQRFIGCVDKRNEEDSQTEFLEKMVDRIFTNLKCTPGPKSRVQRPLNDCLHITGEGTLDDSKRPYFLAVEAFITNNDLVILLVAGYSPKAQSSPATENFFQSFTLTGQE